jgi:hypothetical protein
MFIYVCPDVPQNSRQPKLLKRLVNHGRVDLDDFYAFY